MRAFYFRHVKKKRTVGGKIIRKQAITILQISTFNCEKQTLFYANVCMRRCDGNHHVLQFENSWNIWNLHKVCLAGRVHQSIDFVIEMFENWSHHFLFFFYCIIFFHLSFWNDRNYLAWISCDRWRRKAAYLWSINSIQFDSIQFSSDQLNLLVQLSFFRHLIYSYSHMKKNVH